MEGQLIPQFGGHSSKRSVAVSVYGDEESADLRGVQVEKVCQVSSIILDHDSEAGSIQHKVHYNNPAEQTTRLFVLLCAAVALHIATANPVLQVEEEPLPVLQNNSGVCPPDFREHGGRCFAFIPEPLAWIDAEQHCWLSGANLASISDWEEFEFLIELMQEYDYHFLAWIGASDAVRFGYWLWSDGTPFHPWTHNLPKSSFRWRHCLTVHSDGFLRFERRDCEDKLPFLCGTRPGC